MKMSKIQFLPAMLGLLLVSTQAFGQSAFSEEPFSLFGYLVNYADVQWNLNEDNQVKNSSFGDVVYMRIKGDWSPEDSLRFHLEAAYQGSVGNMNPYAAFDSYGASPFSQSQFPLEDFHQTFTLDHVWGSINFWRFDLQFGKIPIAWGTGYVFNPTAKVSAIPFLETITEETPGTLGVIPSFSFMDELALSGYVAFQERLAKQTAFPEDGHWENLPFGLKVQGILGSFDLSLSWFKEVSYGLSDQSFDDMLDEQARAYIAELIGTSTLMDFLPGMPEMAVEMYKSGVLTGLEKLVKYKEWDREYYLGIDFVGAVWDFGVYGEAALSFPWDDEDEVFELGKKSIEEHLEFCLGLDYMIPEVDVQLRAEYYHAGRGETNKKKYDVADVFSGKKTVHGEDYLFVNADRLFFDYWTLGVGTLVNLNDGSGVIMPEVLYDMYSNFQVAMGGMVFFGESDDEFGGQSELYGVRDIDLTQPSAFLRCKLSF